MAEEETEYTALIYNIELKLPNHIYKILNEKAKEFSSENVFD